jgi:hypothetical protein
MRHVTLAMAIAVAFSERLFAEYLFPVESDIMGESG